VRTHDSRLRAASRSVAAPGAGLAAASLALALLALAPRAGAAPDTTRAAAPAPRAAAPGVPEMEHVIVVVMENRSADRVIDPKTCPFTARLAESWVYFSNSYALGRPSQPNYLALWAGSMLGVTSNDCPAPGSPFKEENLGHALEAAGKTWRAYSEDLPAPGSAACKAKGSLYTRKHAPWTQFGNLTHANERPYSDLAMDIANKTLPNLAFVVPNNCHNTHDCSISSGDVWLKNELQPLIPAVGRRGLVVLTWDEDDHSSDNHILTVFAGPLVNPGSVSHRRITHYTLLRTLCDGLRIAPFAEAAAESAITDVWYHTAPRPEPAKP
jgi:acid phosphatase